MRRGHRYHFPYPRHAGVRTWRSTSLKLANMLSPQFEDGKNLKTNQTMAINKLKKKSFLPPSTLSQICFYSLDYKTVRSASSDSQNRSHNLPERFEGEVAAIFYFSFIFYFD